MFEPNRRINRLMMYNWELPDWPNFRYSLSGIETLAYRFALEAGEINGLLKSLPEEIRLF